MSFDLAGALNSRNSNSCSSSSALPSAGALGSWGSACAVVEPIKPSRSSSFPSLAWASRISDSSTGDGDREEAGDWTSSRRTLQRIVSI